MIEAGIKIELGPVFHFIEIHDANRLMSDNKIFHYIFNLFTHCLSGINQRRGVELVLKGRTKIVPSVDMMERGLRRLDTNC